MLNYKTFLCVWDISAMHGTAAFHFVTDASDPCMGPLIVTCTKLRQIKDE